MQNYLTSCDTTRQITNAKPVARLCTWSDAIELRFEIWILEVTYCDYHKLVANPRTPKDATVQLSSVQSRCLVCGGLKSFFFIDRGIPVMQSKRFINYSLIPVELAWRSGSVMHCRATVRGSTHLDRCKKSSFTSFARDSKWGCCL